MTWGEKPLPFWPPLWKIMELCPLVSSFFSKPLLSWRHYSSIGNKGRPSKLDWSPSAHCVIVCNHRSWAMQSAVLCSLCIPHQHQLQLPTSSLLGEAQAWLFKPYTSSCKDPFATLCCSSSRIQNEWFACCVGWLWTTVRPKPLMCWTSCMPMSCSKSTVPLLTLPSDSADWQGSFSQVPNKNNHLFHKAFDIVPQNNIFDMNWIFRQGGLSTLRLHLACILSFLQRSTRDGFRVHDNLALQN